MLVGSILFALLLGFGASQASNPPAPTPSESKKQEQPKATERDQETSKDERGTKNEPLIIEILPADNADEIARRKSQHEEDKSFYDSLIAWATIALAVVTTGLAVFTGRLFYATNTMVKDAKATGERQAEEMKESLEIANRSAQASERTVKTMEGTAERRLRAYVAVETISINEVFAGGTPYTEVRIKNFGQTPAYKFSCLGGITLGTSFDILPPATGSIITPQSGLPPTATVVHKDGARRPLKPEEIAALTTGAQTLWVYGIITYRDAFGIDRFTNYRFMIGGGVGIHNTMCTCEEGNNEN